MMIMMVMTLVMMMVMVMVIMMVMTMMMVMVMTMMMVSMVMPLNLKRQEIESGEFVAEIQAKVTKEWK